MNTSSQIIHNGVIQAVKDGVAYVSFKQDGGCGGCAARSACDVTEHADRELKVPLDGRQVTGGERVLIYISPTNGLRAVLLSYVFPLVLILVVLIVTIELGISEPMAGILAIGSLLPYFLTLKVFSRRIKNNISFEVLANE